MSAIKLYRITEEEWKSNPLGFVNNSSLEPNPENPNMLLLVDDLEEGQIPKIIELLSQVTYVSLDIRKYMVREDLLMGFVKSETIKFLNFQGKFIEKEIFLLFGHQDLSGYLYTLTPEDTDIVTKHYPEQLGVFRKYLENIGSEWAIDLCLGQFKNAVSGKFFTKHWKKLSGAKEVNIEVTDRYNPKEIIEKLNKLPGLVKSTVYFHNNEGLFDKYAKFKGKIREGLIVDILNILQN